MNRRQGHQEGNPTTIHLPTQDQQFQYSQADAQPQHRDNILHTTAMFRYTYSIPDLKEIHSIITKMRNNATPGPDGLNAPFYKSA